MFWSKTDFLGLTSNVGVFGNVIIADWSSWAVCAHISDVFNQILFNSWFVEQVGQESDAVDLNFLGMCAQIVDIGNVTATDAKDHLETIFTAHFQPFLSQAFALVDSEARSFAGHTVHQHALDTLWLQVIAVLINHFVIDTVPAISAKAKQKLKFMNENIFEKLIITFWK